MDLVQDLTAKFFKTCNVMMCDLKEARTYGTPHALTYSDMTILKCIEQNKNTKAGELSTLLGMTNGAVTQFAKKLMQKVI